MLTAVKDVIWKIESIFCQTSAFILCFDPCVKNFQRYNLWKIDEIPISLSRTSFLVPISSVSMIARELKEAEDRNISKLKEMLKSTVKHEKDDLKTNLKA